jgi:protein transport protein SEC24
MPSSGPGKLKKREDLRIVGSEKEKSLYQGQDTFYATFGAECSKNHVSIDLFLFSSAATYMDTATLCIFTFY